MANPRLKLDNRAMRQVMRSPEVRKALQAEAEKIAARAGDGFETETRTSPIRARTYVKPATIQARRRQARDHVLERAVGGG